VRSRKSRSAGTSARWLSSAARGPGRCLPPFSRPRTGRVAVRSPGKHRVARFPRQDGPKGQRRQDRARAGRGGNRADRQDRARRADRQDGADRADRQDRSPRSDAQQRVLRADRPSRAMAVSCRAFSRRERGPATLRHAPATKARRRHQRYHDAGAAAGVRPALILGLTRRRREARCAASPPLPRSQLQPWPR
jgi:hypothetical protein